MRKIILGITLVLMFFFGMAFGHTALAWQEPKLNEGEIDIWFSSQNGGIQSYVVVDEMTKVNYIVISRYPSTGSFENSITMCPRYNANGTLYTGQERKEFIRGRKRQHV